jgi:hypothetical protein
VLRKATNLLCLMFVVAMLASTAFAKTVVVAPAQVNSGRASVATAADALYQQAFRQRGHSVVAGDATVTADPAAAARGGGVYVVVPKPHTWSGQHFVGLKRIHKGECDPAYDIYGPDGELVYRYTAAADPRTGDQKSWSVQPGSMVNEEITTGAMLVGGAMASNHLFKNWVDAQEVGWGLAGLGWIFHHELTPAEVAVTAVGTQLWAGNWFEGAGPVVQYGLGPAMVIGPALRAKGDPDELEQLALVKGITYAITNQTTIGGL